MLCLLFHRFVVDTLSGFTYTLPVVGAQFALVVKGKAFYPGTENEGTGL